MTQAMCFHIDFFTVRYLERRVVNLRNLRFRKIIKVFARLKRSLGRLFVQKTSEVLSASNTSNFIRVEVASFLFAC